MKEEDIGSEIAQLKQQIDSLIGLRKRTEEGSDAAAPEASPLKAFTEEAGPWIKDLLKQAEDLIGGMDLQLKDVPAKTALIIFALGVLTGRLLSRRG